MRSDAEFEVPPASVCTRCGSSICDGCYAPAASLPKSVIAWEAPGPLSARLWSTARASALVPELVFGKLRDGPVLAACSFALVVELCALGSLALVGLAFGFLVAPDVAGAVVTTVASNGPLACAVVAAVPVLAAVMVGLHAFWGITLELGAKLAGADWRFARGLRFAFYSCGWDLLTSPAGLVFGCVSGGASRAWRDTMSAARVPRTAMDAYLLLSRELSPARVIRARRLAVLITAGPVSFAILAMVWLTVATILPG
ncbi:MAG TPA: hypothetical protein VI197_34125 [Polyangiaceae bacterium]